MIKNVLVTGIGGNVAQGILRNIIKTKYNIALIGTDTTISGGNHLCDKFYKIPFANKKNYIPIINKICVDEKIDLIIPGTDIETLVLSRNLKKLPKIVCSDSHTVGTFYDKYKTYKEFKDKSIPFAKSFLPSEYNDEFENTVVKPRKGNASKNIFINPKNIDKFSDDYVVQKKLRGIELTTAFYVNKKHEVLGQITFKREILTGFTSKCEVSFKYNKKIEEIISMLNKNYNLRGPCNIQSIVGKNGSIMPFEINCRFSGTNSIRSQFGFEDVKYSLDENLYDKKLKSPIVIKGSAVRMIKDIIYPNTTLSNLNNNKDKFYEF